MPGGYGLVAAAGFINGINYAMDRYSYHGCCCRPYIPPRPYHLHYGPPPLMRFRYSHYHDYYSYSPHRYCYFHEPYLYRYRPPYHENYPYHYIDPYRTGYTFGELTGYYLNDRRDSDYGREYRDYGDYVGRTTYDYSRGNTNQNTGQINKSGSSTVPQKTNKGGSHTGGKVSSPYIYAGLDQNIAMGQAAADLRLEGIGGGGTNWSCSSASFANDITYATRGTSRLLDAVVAKIRETYPDFELVVTSALGTNNSPHDKTIVNSHYNPNNVKLDFSRYTWNAEPEDFAAALMATGYFEFADVETHKNDKGWHIDAMFKPEMLAKAARGEI